MKATEIKNAKYMAIIYIFRGFYLLMSFSGSIGSLVKDSGLKEALGVVYAENTVPHMITRMAISTAFRGHVLVQSALATNLFNLFIVDSEDEAEGIVKDISVEGDEKTVGTVKREDVLRELKNVTKYVKNEGENDGRYRTQRLPGTAASVGTYSLKLQRTSYQVFNNWKTVTVY